MLIWSGKLQVLAKSTILQLFREIRHVLQPFAEKLTQTPKHSSVDQRVPRFGQIDDFLCFFAKCGNFCIFLPKSSPKRRIIVVSSKTLQVFAKSRIFQAFSRNEESFATFSRRVNPTTKHASLPKEVSSFSQIDDFSFFFAKSGTYCNFFPKS